MLRQISVADVVIGMYIHELCGSWMDHPFWKSGFLLDSQDDLVRLRQSSVTQVWIDTSKGLAPKDVTEDKQTQQDLVVQQKPITKAQSTNISDEVRRAARICNSARSAVIGMFGEARMVNAIELEQVEDAINQMSESISRHPGALISLARLKQADEYTYMHSVAVAALMMALARQMNLSADQIKEAGLAGLLHDLGKMSIDDDILNKPSSLTDSEFEQIRMHPEYGARILERSMADVSAEVYDACLHHHEKIDGSGYPHRLSGDEIGQMARMVTVCDVYDAVTSDRPYKKGWGPAEAVQRMAQWKGHFDQTIFQMFIRTVGIYPIGSLVRLTSGRLAVVIEQDEKSLLTPTVKVFFSSKSKVPIEQEIVKLSANGVNEKIVARENVEDWGFKNIDQLWME